ncbi:MAG: RDD family protein [Oscillospiraceae bacterium]|nr:RDD family protein [Oscillospiraceae bacterium]
MTTIYDKKPPEPGKPARLWQLEPDERKERLNFPWRRFFARNIDLVFYLLIWWVVAYLAFHWNVLSMYWFLYTPIMVAISIVLMLVLEPVLLAVIGTTPGKALLGLRVRNKEGRRLSLGQAYTRIGRVFSHGYGYVIIPIYNLVMMHRSYKKCEIEGVAEWDEKADIECTFRGKFPFQIILGLIFTAILAVLITGIYYAADMPRQRGELTVAQFNENLDNYWQFHDTGWNTELFFRVRLMVRDTSIGYIFDRMDEPEVRFEVTNGIVTGVSFEVDDAPRAVLMALPVWLRGYVVTFVGAQDDMNFIRMHSPDGIINRLLVPLDIIGNWDGAESVRFEAAGIEIYFNIVAGARVSAQFSMRKV